MLAIQEPTPQDVDPRQDQQIDPFIVNFVGQVSVNGRNKGKLLEGIKTACAALQDLEL